MTTATNGPRPGGQSRWADLGGPARYLDFGGPADAPMIVCVHGLGGSAVNWWAIAPLLTDRYRVLAPDLAGHGLTQSRGRGTDVASNRVLLHRFIQEMAAGPVILMGNSMGGMISMLEAVAAPGSVAGLILLDPAMPAVPARPDPQVAAMFALYLTPGVGRLMLNRRRHQAPEAAVASIMSLVCADPARVPADAMAQHVEVARQRAAFAGTDRDYAAAVRSVVATASRSQSYRHGIRSISCPVLVVHGDRDRLVPLAAARAAVRANPSWSLVVLPGVGHVPQLEAPQDTARVITDWLGSAGRHAVQAAAPVTPAR
jgi:pimeloyl-ACP methyl ester carboxylesterase